ncbi:MAG: hypothetical protein CMF41_04410 [Legionellales bacterium]|nr:hypothetical protein [Legionellales bacterium]
MVSVLHFLPLLLFFTSYKFFDIYVATSTLMVSSSISFAMCWFIQKKIISSDLIVLCFILACGSATLLFKNPLFIKWKVTVIFWLISVGMTLNFMLKNKPASYMLLNDKIDMPISNWQSVDLMIIFYAFLMGLINWTVFHYLSESAWVNFKTFGLLSASIIFSVIVALYVSQNAEAIR